MTKINVSKFIAVTAGLILLSSCANMQAMIENQVQEEKEISVDQKLQVSIPIPDNSKYLQTRLSYLVKVISFLEYCIYNMINLQMTLQAFIERI